VVDERLRDEYDGAEQAEYSDVLIIGAGISGIGAAYRIHEKNPKLSYAVLERRAQIGGTWDLFRYPGIRSDSDIFTLSFPYEPWTRPENVADGDDIREYLTQTARKYGIDEHIRFNTHVLAADWDSTTDTWTVHTESGGQSKTYRGRFLFFGTGYYNYDEPYRPEFEGIEQFSGDVVHPQQWPESLDYTGKRVAVIGSGATAVSMIPSLTEKAAHVTMVQRSPTYMLSMPRIHPVVQAIRKVLPRKPAHAVVRLYNTFFTVLTYVVARKAPGFSRWLIRAMAKKSLPEGYPVDIHFKPRYDPWDQRLCLILDNDLYTAVGEGRAEVVTDTIDHIDASGIVLKSGRHVDADVIVTATGLQLQALGGVAVSIDGAEIKPQDRFV
jgi:cation diffusion facilitator CzcD-associated flavoprotein CzcO